MQRKARIIYNLIDSRLEARHAARIREEDEWLALVSQADRRVDEKFNVTHGKVGEKSTGALLIGLSAAVKSLIRRKAKS